MLELLAPPEGPSLIIDATLGEGGHAAAFLRRYPEARVLGVEIDEVIAEAAARRLASFGDRFRLWRGWFSDFFDSYGSQGEGMPDRIVFDLGISTFHYRSSGRGFSFAAEEPLDMRLDLGQETSAADLIRRTDEQELADMFFQFGEERFSRRIARRIVEARRQRPIETAAELAAVIRAAMPPKRRYGRIHPATRCFQALRIVVNDELGRLAPALEGALEALRPGGRIGVIAFHSLEDRIVKGLFREARDAGRVTLVAKLKAGAEETTANPASRSARLRVAEIATQGEGE